MRAVAEADRRRRAADLLHRDDMLEIAEAEAVELLLYGDAVKAGDRVLFSKYSETEVKIGGEDFLLLREDDLLGIIER